MNTKALIWVIFGLILIFGGVVASVREGREIESRGPRPVPAVPEPADSPVPTPTEKNFDTGFTIDPIKGLKRKDENREYFK